MSKAECQRWYNEVFAIWKPYLPMNNYK
jgi:hypothetical protein